MGVQVMGCVERVSEQRYVVAILFLSITLYT